MTPPNMWTAEQDLFLTAHWQMGWSAGKIAEQLPGRSRNSVIGRKGRLGLIDHGPERIRFPSVPKGRKFPDRQVSRRIALRKTSPMPMVIIEPIIDEEIPVEQRRQICDLTSGMCHWPVGDPKYDPANFFYCSAPAAEGQSYCLGHCFRAFAPRNPVTANA